MKLLLDDIYGKLSAIIPNTYFNQLPANIDASQNFCVYEVEVDSSMNTLHEIDFEQEVEIRVKVLSQDVNFLFTKVEEIRQAVLLHTANYYSAIVKNTVPVFFDENLKLSQYTIIFSVNRGSVPFTGTLVNKYAPDATAIVNDQDGTELARRDIASGDSEIIEVNTGTQVLYTYNYGALNTGQDTIYATGDDKWVRDNVFNTEIALWPTSRAWVFPVLDPNNPTKLLRGATPEGTNIFGNLERFTDDLGAQIYDNDLVIDHYTGLMIYKDIITRQSSFINHINYFNNLSVDNKTGFHLANIKEQFSIYLFSKTGGGALQYPPFNDNTIETSNGSLGNNKYYRLSTTPKNDTSLNYMSVYNIQLSSVNYEGGLASFTKSQEYRGLGFRKAFTYDPTADTTKLILS